MANYMQTLLDPISQGPNTPAGVKASRDYALALLKDSQAPVAHWAQGIGNIVKALQGGYTEYQAAEQEQKGKSASTQALLAALGLNQTPQATTSATTPQQTPSSQPQFAPPPGPQFADIPGITEAQTGQTQQMTNLPRGLRNNNPGNIIDGPFAKSLPGYTGSDGKFAKFASLDDGNEAMNRLLQSYGNRGINTPNAIINRWAPPSDNNPTNVYAANVAKALGVDPNAQIDLTNPDILSKVRGAITRQENGAVASLPQASVSAAPPASAGVVQPSPVATPPINRQALASILNDPWASDATKTAVLQQLLPKSPIAVKEGETLLDPRTYQPIYQNQKNENQWKEIGKDDYGNPRYGWVNPRGKQVEEQQVPRPVNPAVANAQQPPNAPTSQNEITDPNNPNYPNIRPAPAGANTKDWYEAETKRVAAVRNARPQVVQSATGVIQDIDRIIGMVKEAPGKTTGTGAQLLSHIGGSKAKDVSALLNTIKANASFDKLQAMRASSPTGGALGNVSDNENIMLQSAIAALDQSQSADQFTRNLNRVKNAYMDAIHGTGYGPPRIPIDAKEDSTKTAPIRVNTPQEAMQLPKGTRFIDPNGQERIVP